MKLVLLFLLVFTPGCATTYTGTCRFKNKVYTFKQVSIEKPYRNEIWVRQDEHFFLAFDVNACQLVKD